MRVSSEVDRAVLRIEVERLRSALRYFTEVGERRHREVAKRFLAKTVTVKACDKAQGVYEELLEEGRGS